ADLLALQVRALNGLIEHSALTDEDVVRRLAPMLDGDKVADLPLQTYVRDEPLISLGIQPRQVAGVGIAVGVAVDDVKEVQKVVAVRDGGLRVSHVDLLSGRGGFG